MTDWAAAAEAVREQTTEILPWVREQIAAARQQAEQRKKYTALRALFDPAAVLAQCEAHERILNFAEGMATPDETLFAALSHETVSLDQARGAATVSGGYLIALVASAYQHRPGYRREWKP